MIDCLFPFLFLVGIIFRHISEISLSAEEHDVQREVPRVRTLPSSTQAIRPSKNYNVRLLLFFSQLFRDLLLIRSAAFHLHELLLVLDIMKQWPPVEKCCQNFLKEPHWNTFNSLPCRRLGNLKWRAFSFFSTFSQSCQLL